MNEKDRANEAIEGDDGSERKTIAAKIADSFAELGPQLFHSREGISYATLRLKNRIETLPISSNGFKRFLRYLWFQKAGKPAAATTINDAVALIEAVAAFDGAERSVYVRVASETGKVWIDLANAAGEVVEVSVDGWYVRECPANIKFVRPAGTLPLPSPRQGGSFQTLRSVINVTDEDWPLVVGWMLGVFLPHGPFPILFLNGPQNSAKTTATKIIRSLTDPNEVFADTLKNDERVLAISAIHQHVLCFENISKINDRTSDFLCRISTGGGYRTRSLFTNQDEVLLSFTRPLLINGIGDLARRSDLLERAIIVHCPPIPTDSKRRERDVMQDLASMAPSVFGALLDGVSAALGAHDSIPVTNAVRMADFLAFVEAGEPALGFTKGTIRSAYVANQAQANVVALEESPVAAAIRSEAFPIEWEGTPAELLEYLFPGLTERERKNRGLPTSPVSISNALRRVEPNLTALGITVERERTSSERLIRIRKQVVTVVTPSPAETDHHDGYDDSFSDLASTYRFGGEL